jgi:hypothetical protein
MAHFAELNELNIVTQVIVVNNDELLVNGVESETKGIEFCQSLFGGRWVQTSYNSNFRKHYAGINYTYDLIKDVFIPPQPEGLNSWILDEETYTWVAPISMPSDDKVYDWDEKTTSWVEFTEGE